jgi:Transglutaminase-like superfamily
MLNSVRRWRALNSTERRAVLAVLRRMILVIWRLRIGGYRRLVSDLESSTRTSYSHQALQPHRVSTLVDRVADVLPGTQNCLIRSLTLAWLLRDGGRQPLLRLGVRRDDGVLLFHAWIELDGQVVNDLPEIGDRFAAFGDQGPPRGAVFV